MKVYNDTRKIDRPTPETPETRPIAPRQNLGTRSRSGHRVHNVSRVTASRVWLAQAPRQELRNRRTAGLIRTIRAGVVKEPL